MAQSHIVSSKISQSRVAKWLLAAKPIQPGVTWTEIRQAIVINNHTYLVSSGQVYQCVHCGHYDPDWVAHEVLEYFKINFGVKPIEIEIECSLPATENKS
jgi:hypothetical protein